MSRLPSGEYTRTELPMQARILPSWLRQKFFNCPSCAPLADLDDAGFGGGGLPFGVLGAFGGGSAGFGFHPVRYRIASTFCRKCARRGDGNQCNREYPSLVRLHLGSCR
jgi:hypothetical protein